MFELNPSLYLKTVFRNVNKSMVLKKDFVNFWIACLAALLNRIGIEIFVWNCFYSVYTILHALPLGPLMIVIYRIKEAIYLL